MTYQASKSYEDCNKIMNHKHNYTCILGGQKNKSPLALRQKHFKMGDKPGWLLVWHFRGAQASRSIQCIWSRAGTLLTNPEEINDCCKAENFYKKFCDMLTPLLLRMICSPKRDKASPKTPYEANISLILKQGKEETELNSCRPIPLQKLDRKVITKMLANQLNKHVIYHSSWSVRVHPTQVLLESIPFKIVKDHLTYLGLTIPKDPKLILKYILQSLSQNSSRAWKVGKSYLCHWLAV